MNALSFHRLILLPFGKSLKTQAKLKSRSSQIPVIALGRREICTGVTVAAMGTTVSLSASADSLPSPSTTSPANNPPSLETPASPSTQPAPASSPSPFPQKVFVAGATGATGKRVVRKLLEKGVKVRAGVRSLEKAEAEFGKATDSLEFFLFDVNGSPAKLKEALKGSEAVIVATGFSPSLDLTQAWKVDNLGTVALVDASLANGINRFVLVSSILTNGAAWGQALNPNYLLLNLFGLVLIAKLQAEKYIQRSGIDYTIIRPGGLKNDPPSGNIILSAADTLSQGSIARDSVADVAVEALYIPQASFKVVEIVSSPDAPKKTLEDLFRSLPQ